MFPVHVQGDFRELMNNVGGSGGGGVVRLDEREKVEHWFFRGFVVLVRFWGVVTAIGEL